MKTRFATFLALICAIAFTAVSYAGISVSSPGVTCGWFTIWYGLGSPHPGKIAYVAVRKPNGYYYTVAQAENVSDYSQSCQVYADIEGTYTFYYDYSDSTTGTPRTNVLQQNYYIQLRNRIQWDPDASHITSANPGVERPGQISTITAGFKNIGPSTWGGNHYIEFKDNYGTPIYYASVSGVSPNAADSRSYAVSLPNLGGVGTATYHLRAEENNVEMFGSIRDVPIGVDYPPNTSLSISATSLPGAGSVQLTSITTAQYGDLINQAIDYIPPGGTWQSNTVSGTAGAGTRWDGGWVSSHTLASSIPVTTPGTWQFRARGQNSRGQLSNFQYQSVTVAAGAAPVTSIAASSGSSNITGNTNSTTPPVLTVNIGDSFTITANSSDSSNDLTSQQFDLSANGGAWSPGNAGNARLWLAAQGAAVGSNTLAKTFVAADFGPGTYRFRAQAADAQNQTSTYQYVDVKIAPAPVTTLVVSSGSTSATGNISSSSPPVLSVTLGQSFTITATTTDGDNDLMAQQFDLSANGGAWSLGNLGNARLWQLGPTGSNTLAKTFVSADLGIGTYRFRAQGVDARSQYSTYKYIDVVISAAVAPTITSHPSSSTVNEGGTVTFGVQATGTSPFYYQWRKNGVNIASATASTYTISGVQVSDSANGPGYTVVVSNSVGSVVSNPATLSVSSIAPVRLALQYWQSGDCPNREYGGRYVYDPNKENPGECHTEWVCHDDGNGGETCGDEDVCSDTTYGGDVWVPDVYPDGLYGSRWDTTAGTFGSPLGTDTGAYNPGLTDRGYLLNQYNRSGQMIALRLWAYAPAGNCNNFQARLYGPSGNYLWGSSIASGGYWDCQFGDSWWGDGTYRIEISFSGATGTPTSSGTVTYYLPLNVTRPPASTIAINKTSIASGDAVQITVSATAPSNLRYVNVDQTSPNWGYYGYMGANDVGTEAPPSGAFLDVGGNLSGYIRTLTLTLTTPNTYTFRSAVSNGSGWYYSSNTVSVTVSASAPVIIAQPQSQNAIIGSQVVFSVSAGGTPTPTYQWRKNGVNISGATGASYTIASAQTSDAGNYDVALSNSAGSVTSATATLAVGPAPVIGLEVYRP